MADKPADQQDATPAAGPGKVSGVTPDMSEQEIRDAGLAVDVPWESGDPQPQRLRYGKLGPDKTYTPEGDAPQTGQPPDAAGTEEESTK